MKLAFRLARLLGRSRRYAVAFLPVLVAIGLGTAVLLGLRAADLSPEQAATAAFGAADGSTALKDQIRPGEDFPELPDVGQQTMDPQVTAFVNWRLSEDELWSGVYIEQAMPSFVTEGKVVLRSGRWPTGRGELVSTSSTPFTIGQSVTSEPEGLGGVVVGIVDLPLHRDPPQVLALPGGWERWDIGEENAELAGLQAQVTYFWTAQDPGRVAADLDRLSDEGGSFSRSGTAAQTMQMARVSAKDLLERGLPITLVIAMGALSTAALLARFHRRNLARVGAVGVPRRTLRLTTVLGAGAGVAVATVLGYGVGLLVTAGTRRILGARSARELRPWEWGNAILAADLVVAVVVILVLAVALAGGRRRRARQPPRLPRTAPAWIGVGSALAVAALASSPLPSFWVLLGIVTGVAVLAACLAVAALDRGREPALGPSLAGRRLIRTRRHELAALTGVLTASVTAVAATIAIAGGAVAHLNRVSGTGYPPGLALFMPGALSAEAAERAQDSFEDHVGLRPEDRVQVDYGLVRVHGDAVPGWVFSSTVDVERVFGALSPGQRDVLRTGLLSPEVTQEPGAGQVGVGWELRWLRAVALADRVDLVDTQAATLYPGLSAEQDRLAAAWAEDEGFSPGLVQATERAPDLPIPWPTQMAAAGFGVVVVAVVFLAIRGELAAYRGLLGTFSALGLGRGWVTGVGVAVGRRIGVTAGGCALLGTWLAVLVAKRALSGSMRLVGVPWIAVVVLCCAVALGAMGGGALAARRMTGRDRTA